MRKKLASVLLLSLVTVVFSTTDSGDLDVLMQFRDELDNPELLKWPEKGGDPCGPPSWNHIYCENSRVTQIQAQGMGLKGTLPQNLNKLSMLKNIGLQRNQLSGKLPSFSGLSNLRYAYLDYNNFDSIPSDFLDGLDNLEVLALDANNFNASTGWSFPKALENSAQLTNLSCMNCNLIGPLPDFLGSMPSLTNLMLSGNRLSGEIQGTFNGSALQTLWLNNQLHGGMTGPIDVVATMESLTVLWLHGNHFTGTIPERIGKLTLLKDLNLNSNKLVGLIPISLANMRLQNLDLNNNHLMGPIPMFKASKVTFASNKFCQATQGLLCSPEVMALIEFLGVVNYPSKLVSSWSGNEPCNWLGIRCNSGKVSVINLPHYNLSGCLSPSVAKLDSLSQIRLQSNNLSGPIPNNWTSLKSLETLDLSGNNISGPLPKFSRTVKLVVTGNPLLNGDKTDHTKGANIPPEKITTKADVFSFGVVLMELLTGLTALDEDRPEETQYLAAWFWHIKPDKEKLRAAINPSLDVKDETFESVSIIAELAGHCTAREPSQRPDMGHAVNVLAPLVEKWKPLDDDNDDYCAIDYSLPLNQMVKDWQEAEGKDFSYLDLEDSKGSIPARPTGFAESFNSADGR
ncbi:hypothetical protein GOBAR_DD25173 [Gossypium barbadense]|nr:hypothetical protein GOBAR_DD25173 [Gossypium barbadense]